MKHKLWFQVGLLAVSGLVDWYLDRNSGLVSGFVGRDIASVAPDLLFGLVTAYLLYPRLKGGRLGVLIWVGVCIVAGLAAQWGALIGYAVSRSFVVYFLFTGLIGSALLAAALQRMLNSYNQKQVYLTLFVGTCSYSLMFLASHGEIAISTAYVFSPLAYVIWQVSLGLVIVRSFDRSGRRA